MERSSWSPAKKVRVYESIYTSPLFHQTTTSEIEGQMSREDQNSHDSDDLTSYLASQPNPIPSRPETDNNIVQSVKSLQNHKHNKMIGTSEGKMLDIEESAIYGNVDSEHKGIHLDSVI
jgi:hypothetical protein